MQTEIIEQEPRLQLAKSFDVQASIRMLKFDLEQEGVIRPETMQRVYDEELCYVAEGINRPLQTEFVLRSENDELMYFDKGEWKPYIGTLIAGLKTAQQEAEADRRRLFLVDKAAIDLAIGFKLQTLCSGESMSWHSDFPEEEYKLYGETFIDQECGFQSKRRMGFLYHAQKNNDGSLSLVSQSVDNSDPDAFAAAISINGNIDSMLAAYDAVLGEKYGGDYYAGRQTNGNKKEENAWTVVMKHKDLMQHYFDGLIKLAETGEQDLEKAKKRITYGVWAALKKRLNSSATVHQPKNLLIPPSPELIAYEVTMAYKWAVAKGEVMFGCGGSIRGENALLSADENDVFDMIFENKTEEDRYGSLTFECPKGHKNKRPRNQLIEKCQICKCDVGCK